MTSGAILSYLHGNSVQPIRAGGRGVTTGPLRSVGSLSCATGEDVAWFTWLSVFKDGAGPVDPVGVFDSGARASGNYFLARGGFFPLAILEERDKVAKLVGSFLIRKKIERPLLSRGDTGSNLVKISVYMGWLSHTSNPTLLYGQEEVETTSLAYKGEASSPHSSCCATRAWGGRARCRLLCHG